MGSEKYPYKGIIDHFANRGFSNGTNAWTDTDHIAYTFSTAGDWSPQAGAALERSRGQLFFLEEHGAGAGVARPL